MQEVDRLHVPGAGVLLRHLEHELGQRLEQVGPVARVVARRGHPQPHQDVVGVRVDVRARLLDVVAQARQLLGGRAHRGHALRGHRDAGRADRGERHPQLPGVGPDLVAERPLRRRRPVRVAGLVAGHDVERGRGVHDGAGQHAVGGQPDHGSRPGVGAQETRPAGGLQPDHAAARRGRADRPAAVAAVPDRAQPCGHRGRGPAAGAARSCARGSTGSGRPRSGSTR